MEGGGRREEGGRMEGERVAREIKRVGSGRREGGGEGNLSQQASQ